MGRLVRRTRPFTEAREHAPDPDVDGPRCRTVSRARVALPRATAAGRAIHRGFGRFDADCIAFSHESATTITPADFNRDGFTDLVVPNRDGGQSHVYLHTGNAGAPEFTRVPFGPPDATIRMAEVADLDADGQLDIVSVDGGGVTLFFGEPNGTFSAGVPVGGRTNAPYALAVADLNHDGRMDLVVGNVEARSVVLFNDGTGRHFTPVPFGDDRGTVYGFAIGDLDKDGHLDIVAARSEAPNVVYFAVPPAGRAP